MSRAHSRPVFFVGMPRSGTTIAFEAMARHPDLAWVSNYCRMYPRAAWVNVLRRLLDNRFIHLAGNKKQYGETLLVNQYLPQPDEAYNFWNLHSGVDLGRSALHRVACPDPTARRLREVTRKVAAWQGRPRFSAKLTGPPRIDFLRSVFPDAIFVHVVRDGRAVVDSLLKVPFWKRKGGLDAPFWQGCLGDADHAAWEASDRDPGVLAALQWQRVVELAREEGGRCPADQYLELSYESLMADPHRSLADLCERCGLPDARQIHEAIDSGPALKNMNFKFQKTFSPDYLEQIEAALRPGLADFGYE